MFAIALPPDKLIKLQQKELNPDFHVTLGKNSAPLLVELWYCFCTPPSLHSFPFLQPHSLVKKQGSGSIQMATS